MFFAIDDHFKGIAAKAQLREGVLSKVADTRWGIEAGVLKIAHDAVITSLLRYGLVVTGSRSPSDLLHRINAAARKIWDGLMDWWSTSRREKYGIAVGVHA